MFNFRQISVKVRAKMKLPKPRKRGNSYTIEIMLGGVRKFATRDTAKECTEWAAQQLLAHKAQVKTDKKQTPTLAELLNLHYEKVGKFKKTQTDKTYKKCLIRDFPWLVEKQVHEITGQDLTQWRNERLKSVSEGSVRREISYLSPIFTYAVKELFLIKNNPFEFVKSPSQPAPRYRRITQDEIDAIVTAAGYSTDTPPSQSGHYTAWAFLFAIETAMRRGEILNIKRSHIKDNYITLPETKNGESRHVPLSPRARALLMQITHDNEYLIPMSDEAFVSAWRRLKSKSGVSDLGFHDTRHEAISRFVQNLKMPVEKLAKVTGHKDIKTLINVYYNPTIDELVAYFQ